MMNIPIQDILYMYYHIQKAGTYIVYNNRTKIFVNSKIEHVLSQFCLQHGSTKEGRIHFFSHTQGIARKVPVLISEQYEIIFFPLFGKRNKDQIWIQYQPIKKIVNEDNISTQIYFKNECELCVNVNYRSIRRQMLRCKRMIKFLQEI